MPPPKNTTQPPPSLPLTKQLNNTSCEFLSRICSVPFLQRLIIANQAGCLWYITPNIHLVCHMFYFFLPQTKIQRCKPGGWLLRHFAFTCWCACFCFLFFFSHKQRFKDANQVGGCSDTLHSPAGCASWNLFEFPPILPVSERWRSSCHESAASFSQRPITEKWTTLHFVFVLVYLYLCISIWVCICVFVFYRKAQCHSDKGSLLQTPHLTLFAKVLSAAVY